MRFVVPKFIEMEARIVGPLTFRQFIFLAIAGAICFLLYFSLAKVNFFLFVFLSFIIFFVASALAFFKIGGRPLPTILANALKFSLSPRTYLWKKKEAPVKVFKKEIKEKKEDELPLKIAGKSQIKKTKSSKGLY